MSETKPFLPTLLCFSHTSYLLCKHCSKNKRKTKTMLMKAWKKMKREVKTTSVKPSSKGQKPQSESCVHKEDSIGKNVCSTSKSTEKKSSKSKSKSKEMLSPKQLKRRSFSSKPIPAEAFERDDLKREHFPSFEDIDCAYYDSDETQSSKADEEVNALHQKYCMSLEDQDVPVFSKSTERMSLDGLKLNLQEHVRDLPHLPPKRNKKYNDDWNNNMTSSFRRTKDVRVRSTPCRQLRFAEDSNSDVQTVVHEIENWKDEPELWWTEEEMKDIRTELKEMVQFFRQHEDDYLESVEMVAEQKKQDSVLESHMKQLTTDYDDARGLESHIVQMFTDHRKEYVDAVLDEQDRCEFEELGYDDISAALRQVALAYSRMPNRLAQRMARCDEISALKATMSKWHPEE